MAIPKPKNTLLPIYYMEIIIAKNRKTGIIIIEYKFKKN